MPKMIANWLSETSRPRIRAGLISAMYIGLVIDAAPTPSPPRMRYRTNSVTLRGMAEPIAEIKNSTAEIISTFFRPRRSLSVPAITAPNTQPTSALLAAQPFSAALSSKCVCMNPIAPLMTAVS